MKGVPFPPVPRDSSGSPKGHSPLPPRSPVRLAPNLCTVLGKFFTCYTLIRSWTLHVVLLNKLRRHLRLAIRPCFQKDTQPWERDFPDFGGNNNWVVGSLSICVLRTSTLCPWAKEANTTLVTLGDMLTPQVDLPGTLRLSTYPRRRSGAEQLGRHRRKLSRVLTYSVLDL